MTQISLIGYGAHVKKNLLSAFKRVDGLEIEGIYVRDDNKYQRLQGKYENIKKLSEIYKSEAKWAYVATPTHSHYALTKQCLLLGMNVICEKPLTDSLERTESLFRLAKHNGLRLVEVDMFTHHKQYKNLESLVNCNIELINCVSAEFSIPHLDKNDFRYSAKDGGGALLDVGYYPISIFLNLFGFPNQLIGKKFMSTHLGVDTKGAAMFLYDRFYCLAEWGIGKHYCNKIQVSIAEDRYEYQRIFSKPADHKSILKKEVSGQIADDIIGADDQFVNMLNNILKNEYQNEEKAMGVARVIQQL